MLFGRKKYSYFNMVMLYLKIVPTFAITKVVYNLICSVMPTLSIVVTAMFLDGAVLVVNDNKRIGEIIFPLAMIIDIRLFNNYSGIIIGLINVRAENKVRSVVIPTIAEKRAKIKFKYYENQDSVDLVNRTIDGFEGNIQFF